MAQITRSTKIGGGTTLSANTLARATDVEADILTLFTAHNNADTGSTAWQVVKGENGSSTVALFNNSTGTNDILDCRDNGSSVFKVADGGTITATGSATLPTIVNTTLSSTTATVTTATITTANITNFNHASLGYRRPNLTYISDGIVDLEVNTGTANTSVVMFPDGAFLTVTENTGSTTKYRRWDITAAAEFTSGTEDSGVRSGLSEAANTRYAIYAVKSVINSANFVLAGDTTFPTQGNFATLNSRYGTNGWVYLGTVVNGNGDSGNAVMIPFVQSGPMTTFYHSYIGNAGLTTAGIQLATESSGATTLTWTYAAGSGNAQIPNTVTQIQVISAASAIAGAFIVKNSGANRVYYQQHMNSLAGCSTPIWIPASQGVNLSNGPATSETYDITMCGWFDSALVECAAPTL